MRTVAARAQAADRAGRARDDRTAPSCRRLSRSALLRELVTSDEFEHVRRLDDSVAWAAAQRAAGARPRDLDRRAPRDRRAPDRDPVVPRTLRRRAACPRRRLRVRRARLPRRPRGGSAHGSSSGVDLVSAEVPGLRSVSGRPARPAVRRRRVRRRDRDLDARARGPRQHASTASAQRRATRSTRAARAAARLAAERLLVTRADGERASCFRSRSAPPRRVGRALQPRRLRRLRGRAVRARRRRLASVPEQPTRLSATATRGPGASARALRRARPGRSASAAAASRPRPAATSGERPATSPGEPASTAATRAGSADAQRRRRIAIHDARVPPEPVDGPDHQPAGGPPSPLAAITAVITFARSADRRPRR